MAWVVINVVFTDYNMKSVLILVLPKEKRNYQEWYWTWHCVVVPSAPLQVLVNSGSHVLVTYSFSVTMQCAAVTTQLSAINVPPQDPCNRQVNVYYLCLMLLLDHWRTLRLYLFLMIGRQWSMAIPQPENWKIEIDLKGNCQWLHDLLQFSTGQRFLGL